MPTYTNEQITYNLKNIDSFLKTNTADKKCDANLFNIISSVDTSSVNNATIGDAYSFLTDQLTNVNNNASHTRKGDFLTLYNNQYLQNSEIFFGIIVISSIIAKMMFYPMDFQK